MERGREGREAHREKWEKFKKDKDYKIYIIFLGTWADRWHFGHNLVGAEKDLVRVPKVHNGGSQPKVFPKGK